MSLIYILYIYILYYLYIFDSMRVASTASEGLQKNWKCLSEALSECLSEACGLPTPQKPSRFYQVPILPLFAFSFATYESGSAMLIKEGDIRKKETDYLLETRSVCIEDNQRITTLSFNEWVRRL